MKKKSAHYKDKLRIYCAVLGRLLESNPFFYAVLGVFVAQAVWVAGSGAYSMAYDEFFHLGLIQEYAKSLSPFIGQPDGPAVFGAVARDPSFLYHYILSFPYRIIASLWQTLTPQVIILRLINIALFTWGLVLYRAVLFQAGLSRRITHIILLFFTLIPTVVMLAAQLNYDNMMFLASGAALLLATNVTLAVRRHESFSPLQLISLVTILLAGSIVKYAFLPLAMAIGGFVLVQLVLAFRRKQLIWRAVVASFSADFRRPLGYLAILGLIFVGVLFIQRVGGNLLMYGTPVPDCSTILSDAECRTNDVYVRNAGYKDKNYPASVTSESKRAYPKRWYKTMLRESFFVVGPRQIGYPTAPPLPTAYRAGKIIVPAMTIVILFGFVWLWRSSPIWQLFIVVTITYGGVLFLRNYTEYIRLGVPAAIHGRYIVYVVPLVSALSAAVLAHVVHGWGRRAVYGITTVLLGMMIMGGGWLPFVIRSADSWMWPHAVPASRTLRSTLWYVIPK